MRFIHWLKQETLSIIPAVIYFMVTLNLIHFLTGIGLPTHVVRPYTYLGVTISSLIIGKVLLIAHTLPFLNHFSNKPLIYSIVWKFLFYALFIFAFRLLETYTHFLLSYHHMHVAYTHWAAELKAPLFWSTQAWVLLALLFFVVVSEFVRVLGKPKVLHLLLG